MPEWSIEVEAKNADEAMEIGEIEYDNARGMYPAEFNLKVERKQP